VNYDSDEIKVEGLEKLLKALRAKPPVARVGILGASNRTPKEGEKSAPSNALVGAVHEFGSPIRGIPARSFLRMPLTENLTKEIENSGALDKEVLEDVIKSGTIVPWLRKITIIAEGIVLEAFDTGGYGQWKPWKNRNYTNNTGMLLVDTQQLRNSISSEVKE
jgi:phage gpG-like protein